MSAVLLRDLARRVDGALNDLAEAVAAYENLHAREMVGTPQHGHARRQILEAAKRHESLRAVFRLDGANSGKAFRVVDHWLPKPKPKADRAVPVAHHHAGE